MKYLEIISATRRIEAGGDVEIRWDISSPEMKEWLHFPDIQVLAGAVNLYGNNGHITIAPGSVQVDAHGGMLSFAVPPTIKAGSYQLTFDLTFTAKNQSEIFGPNSELEIAVLSSGGGSEGKPKVYSVQPNSCMIEQLKVTRKLRFQMHGENLDQGDVIGAMLIGRATSNRGIPLRINERTSGLIDLMGTLREQQIGWFKPGIADIAIQTDKRQLNAQIKVS
jgi:hypothetical protein